MTRARDLAAGTFELATGGVLKLETSDTTVTDGSVLGKIEFKAPDEASGTDAILVGAAIEAVAEGTFAADNNATELVFKTGASAAADAKMTLTSGGNLGIGTSSPSRIAELYGTSNPALRLNNGTDVADIGLATAAGALLTGSTDGALVLARGGANSINLGTNGQNRVTIDSSGNVGIGTSSPNSTGGETLHINSTTYPTIHLTNSTSGTSSTDGVDIGINGTSMDLFIRNREAADILFYTSASERMRIDSSGNVGIGTSSPSAPLHLYGASNQLITVESTDANANIAFKDNSTTNVGQVGIKTDDLFFATGTTERMRLDSSGNLLVGKTATGISAAGHSYKADGTWEVRRDLGTANSSSVGYLSRGTTDGSILTFYKDTTAVGSIGVSGGNLTIDGGSAKVGLAFRGAEIRPRDNGADDDDGVDLGSGTYRFKDVYLSGGVYLGGSSDSDVGIDIKQANLSALITLNGRMNNSGTTTTAIQFKDGSGGSNVGSITVTSGGTSYNTSSDYRLKENVVDLTGAVDRVKQIPVHRFNFISDTNKTVDGFLAHEVEDIVPEAVTGEKDAMRDEEYEVTPAVLDDDGNVVTEAVMGTRSVPDYQGIDQSKLVPLLTAALQEALTKIDALETRITALEG